MQNLTRELWTDPAAETVYLSVVTSLLHPWK